MVKLMSGANRLVAFCELQRGDTFRHADCVYIKTAKHHSDQDDAFNAVCITDGDFGCFDTQEFVEPVDIEAIIK